MSRTDKDMPWHVTATWWRPWHVRCENTLYNDSIGSCPTTRACDLPPEPCVRGYMYVRTRCSWNPVWERHHYPNPPRWYINHVWTARERLASRTECLKAAKEYRGSGEVETVPTTRQNRHCAQWLWS